MVFGFFDLLPDEKQVMELKMLLHRELKNRF